MSREFIDLVRLFKAELELCELTPDQTVGIYSEGGIRRGYAEAFAQAAAELGAPSFHVDLPVADAKDLGSALGGRAEDRGLAAVPAAVEAFKRCDLMIDLMLILFEPELEEIRGAGTRVLSVVEPPEVLARLFPTLDDRRRAEGGLSLLAPARTLRVTSAAGTDIEYEVGDFTPFCQYGYVAEPGRWDHFAGTLVVHCPNDGGTNGRIVLQPGDIVWPFGRFIRDSVEITVKTGLITSIRGEADALFLNDYLHRFDDPRAFAMSHVGWGLNPRAWWDSVVHDPATIGMDQRSYLGSVMLATGPNAEFGGDNTSPCHLDLPLRGCSLSIDGHEVVAEGSVLESSATAAADAPTAPRS